MTRGIGISTNKVVVLWAFSTKFDNFRIDVNQMLSINKKKVEGKKTSRSLFDHRQANIDPTT